MSFVEVPLGAAQEAEAVPEAEYDLRVAKFEQTTSKAGNNMYKAIVLVESEDHPNPSPIVEYLTLPNGADDEHANMKLLNIKRFLAIFGVPMEESGFNDEDVVGSTGRCHVVNETYEPEDGEPREQNKLRMPPIQG